MAVIRKKTGSQTPSISTASLPDVIFMILFFFMVSTTMREHEIKLDINLPAADQAQRLGKKSKVSYIYVGIPLNGTETRIQLNDAYRQLQDIPEFIAAEKEKLSEKDQKEMTVAIKADKKTKMKIINEIKQELRKTNTPKINYTATGGRSE